MNRFVTINDETQEFIRIDAIDGCMACDAEKANETGYHAIILTIDARIGTPLTPEQLRSRIDEQLRCPGCDLRTEPCHTTH